MPTVTGVVEAKTRTGKAIKLGEDWWSAYSAATLADINKGDTVSFEGVLKGDYKNIKGKVTKTGEGTVVSSSSWKTGDVPVLRPKLDRDRTIIRQNALTNARELVVGMGENEVEGASDAVEKIIQIAREFEAYTSGDLDIEEASAKLTEMDIEE